MLIQEQRGARQTRTNANWNSEYFSSLEQEESGTSFQVPYPGSHFVNCLYHVSVCNKRTKFMDPQKSIQASIPNAYLSKTHAILFSYSDSSLLVQCLTVFPVRKRHFIPELKRVQPFTHQTSLCHQLQDKFLGYWASFMPVSPSQQSPVTTLLPMQ